MSGFGKKNAGPNRAANGSFGKKTNRTMPDPIVTSQSYQIPSMTSSDDFGSQESYGNSSLQLGRPAFWIRIVAMAIDGVILFIPMLAISAVVATEESFTLMIIVLGLLQIFYHTAMEASPMQGTLGKFCCGLVVTDNHGAPLSFGRSLLRNSIGRALTGWCPFFIGYIIGAFREDKKTVHDLIAKTVVRYRGASYSSFEHAFG